MKTYAITAILLLSSISFASQKMNFSAKTGMRIADEAPCTELKPLRQGKMSVEVSRATIQELENGSVSFASEKVCDAVVPVTIYEKPDSVSCYSINTSGQTAECHSTSPTGEKENIMVFSLVTVGKNDKFFGPNIITSKSNLWDIQAASATVDDPNLQKISMSLMSNRLPLGDSKYEQFGASVTIEDMQ